MAGKMTMKGAMRKVEGSAADKKADTKMAKQMMNKKRK
jgi:hypothetical protein